MIKDFKTWTANEFRFGISVIPIKVERWLSRNPDALFRIREFALERELDLYLIMAYHVETAFAREIIGYSAEQRVIARTYSSFLKPILDLKPIKNIHFQSESMENFIVAIQSNSDISRKTLAPKLRQFCSTGNSVP